MTIEKMTPEQIADTCERAADLIEVGWQQGEWYSPEYKNMHGQTWPAKYCVEGALAAVLGIDPARLRSNGPGVTDLRRCEVYQAVAATVRRRGGVGIGYLPGWNDASNTTQQEVLDVLHATAKRVLGVDE